MKRALVTGITGQDGSYLAELLIEKGYEVYGLVRRLSTPNYKNIQHILGKIHLIEGDLTDQFSLDKVLRSCDASEVYNLAAQSFVKTSFEQPLYTAEVDGIGVLKLLDVIRCYNPKIRFYQASTSELFGKVRTPIQSEETPFHPRSPYGIAKLFGYWSTVNYREAYGMFASNGILFNHESPRRGLEFVTRKISYNVAKIHLGLEDKIVLGNIDSSRDWGYAKDYVEAMYLIVNHKEPDDFVVATGETHTVREFLDVAFEHIGVKDWSKHVVCDKAHMRPAEVDVLRGDASKAQKVLGWKPKVKFKELAKLMVESDIALVKSGSVSESKAMLR